ncbi:MAG TPA: acyl-CoA thioesterase domain-containing protein, partial [Devosia sp.]|nr:acyl-CoA thioesterase domain-containing protein [Devosia sp.]
MPSRKPKAPQAVDKLLSILDLEPLEQNLFRGRGPTEGWQRVYGGQVLGQALVAAVRTVPEDRIAHSMHGYFLLPGDPTQPIIYDVERIRDGGSFSTRRVKAIQHGRVMFFTSVSFHKAEDSFDHQSAMPEVPAPEDLPSEADLRGRLLEHLPDYIRS